MRSRNQTPGARRRGLRMASRMGMVLGQWLRGHKLGTDATLVLRPGLGFGTWVLGPGVLGWTLGNLALNGLWDASGHGSGEQGLSFGSGSGRSA